MFGLFRRSGAGVDVASFSECGPVRSENQDHFFADRRSLVFCVADGMGGGEGGGRASEMVCDEVSSAASCKGGFLERAREVDEAVRRADRKVKLYAEKAGFSQMGSTATVFVVEGEGARRAVVGNIGDSRLYRLRDGELSVLTRDHTVENELAGRSGPGAGRAAFARRMSALAHVLTRAVGVGEEATLDWRKVDVRAGDVYMLCSDGVYGYVRPSDLRDALAHRGDAARMSARVRRLVAAGGAHDNYTAVIVKIGDLA
jgi:serine/threonine protein phosphatase PrpC